MNNLLKYLQKRDSKTFYTHQILDVNKGVYYLSSDDKDEFYKEYQKCIKMGEKLCIAEKIGNTSPILIDVDVKEFFAFTQQDIVRQAVYVQRILKENVIKNIGNCPPNVGELLCIALEKPPSLDKSGFHLHFPNIFVTIDDFKYLFSLLNTENSPFPLDNVCNKPWLMYGSAKKRTSKTYIATFVVSAETEEKMDLIDFLNGIALHNSNGNEIEYDCVLDKLPRLLSVNPVGKTTFKVQRSTSKLCTSSKVNPNPIILSPATFQAQTLELSEDERIDSFYENREQENCEKNKKDLELAQQLISILDEKRSFDYSTWWEIGVILYNISNGNATGRRLFHTFSARSENYDQDGCDHFWDTFNQRPDSIAVKTMGTLIFLARRDDPENTLRILYEWKHKSNKKLSDTEFRISLDFYQLYPDKFLFCAIRKWFVFEEHTWRAIEEPQLYFVPLFIKLSDWYKQRLDDYEETERKRVSSIIRKLENCSGQRNVIQQASIHYHHRDVYNALDKNPDIIAFKNGVYDFRTMTFRDGRADDYLSEKLPIRFKKPSVDAQERLFDFLRKIFPDEAVLTYFLYQICEVFRGYNREKVALFWTGTGNNGKSVTQKLIETMLGPYALKIPTTVLTGKKVQAGGAYPELARLKNGVRWGVFEEFNSEEHIEIGTLKHLTGNDRIYARDCYERGSDRQNDFTPMFKMIVICNELPSLRNPDEATWNRVRVIPFESLFSSDAPALHQEQMRLKHFFIDTHVDRHFDEMSETLAYVLIETFYKEKLIPNFQLHTPDKVLAANTKYRKKCNKIGQFIDDMMIIVPNIGEASPLDDVYLVFRDWWNTMYDRSKLIDRETFKFEMCKLQSKNNFYSLKINSF
jgi:P4 family phage/plasmid primase-like protien